MFAQWRNFVAQMHFTIICLVCLHINIGIGIHKFRAEEDRMQVPGLFAGGNVELYMYWCFVSVVWGCSSDWLEIRTRKRKQKHGG